MSLDVLIHDALDYFTEAFEASVSEYISNAGSIERDTWPKKEAAARAYVINGATPQQIRKIELEADIRGINPIQYAVGIVGKAEAFDVFSEYASGAKGKARDEIRACTSVEQVLAARAGLDAQMDAFEAAAKQAADEAGQAVVAQLMAAMEAGE